MKPLYLNALGIINAIGSDQASVLRAVLQSDTSGMRSEAGWLLDGDVTVAAVNDQLPDLSGVPIEYQSRNNQLLFLAYQQIEEAVSKLIEQYGRDRIAVVLGSSTSGISETENALKVRASTGKFPDSYRYMQQEMGSSALFLADYLQLKNAALTISTACSSSGKAFSTAKNLIEAGFCDAALVGGVDSLCQLTLNGFNALESIAAGVCKPFCQGRDGISIGEAAALFIVSPEAGEIELAGIGESSDAHHMSAPDPQGLGAEAAMREALDMAGITAEQIDYINLHGTGTVKNDEMEALAVNRIFAQQVPCSSTKSLTGHTLGAAGATEIALCWLLLSQHNTNNHLPPHYWGGEPDTELAKIRYAQPGDRYKPAGERYMLSNSFAFGGNNISLILKKG